MKNYLVGGAIRDQLLGRTVTERDWVVIGATPEQMTEQGFRPVGNDFPVFLHPDTHEEYALARTERKQGHGYRGFTFNADPSVTLEDDLLRRDLTINAMAREVGGPLIDPYGGLQDLKARKLRHVSDAFAEDPLRVLRIARFAARYHFLGFYVVDETLALMRKLVDQGELEHLTPERVWKETERALMEKSPQVYFQVLETCGALKVWFPEFAALRGVPQTKEHHPEVDTLTHQYLALAQSARMGLPLAARYGVLVHDLGKGQTPEAEWPRHIAHEARGKKLADKLSERLKVPRECQTLGALVAEFHTHSHRALELRPETLMKLFKTLDVSRRPERLAGFIGACEADARGRLNLQDEPYPQAAYLRSAANTINNVDIKALQAQGYVGIELGKALEKERIRQLAEHKQQYEKTI